MLDITVIGGGAIAREAYLPVISAHPDTNLHSVVDTDRERALTVASRFGADHFTTRYNSVIDRVDAAIITTPPGSHASIARDCLRAECAVLTEKPIATSYDAAAEVVSMSRERDVLYAVSRQVREAPACRLLNTLLKTDVIGAVQSVDAIFGDGTHYEFASNYRIDESQAWGGAMTDKGPHILDVLSWLFGPAIELERYADDSYGGLEANANLSLTFPASDAEGSLEVTASRDPENRIVVRGTSGTLSADPKAARVTYHDFETDERTPLTFDDDSLPATGIQRIGTQVTRFIDELSTGNGDPVLAETALPVISLIEECFAGREQLELPWERLPEEAGP